MDLTIQVPAVVVQNKQVITQHPTATNYGNPGWYVGSPQDNGSSGGGTGSAASTNDAGGGQPFPIYPRTWIISKKTILSRALWALHGETRRTHNMDQWRKRTHNDPSSNTGGGGGWVDGSLDAINYTGSGGAGPQPNGTGSGGTGLVTFLYDTPS